MLSQIGTGARSTIHKAVGTRDGKIYALKRVVRQDDEDDRFIAQALTEHEVGLAVDHKHVRRSVDIHRVKKWTKIKELFVVLEYVEGMTLDAARPNRLDGFLEIMGKVARGLHALHEVGYVHADMKPNNVILGPKGVVKIIDLGQACPLGHRKERIQGTPDYIAPEQMRRMPLDRTTDVFNLGATMYWVLTETPFPTHYRKTAQGAAQDLVGPEHAQTPKEINPKLPAVLSHLVMDCCKDNPADRPADMMQVLARLDVVLKHWNKQRRELLAKRRAERQDEDRTDDGQFNADEATDE
ncbi:MAG: serine/threonine-protein kinase [Phycisphaerae bacterium]